MLAIVSYFSSIVRAGRRQLMPIFFSGLAILMSVTSTSAIELTLDKAVETAINKTARGDIITGKLEVAEQNYHAKRINFYVPEISINGSLPAYAVDESYRFFGGSTQKKLYRTRDLNFRSLSSLIKV